jgi:RNA polymerase sigma-70 factor (ECF subfamily)
MSTVSIPLSSLTAATPTQLYQAHYRRLYNVCLRIVGNAMDAEEAMHDSFLKIFDRRETLLDEQAFLAWSQRIAIRTAIDRVRKKKIRFEPVDGLAMADETPDDDNNPIPLTVAAIKQALAELPDGYRVILSLRLFERYTFPDIAEALAIKESTVRSQYARGRQKLAEKLKERTLQDPRL